MVRRMANALRCTGDTFTFVCGEMFAAALAKRGFDAEVAASVAAEVLADFQFQFGGETFYVPRGRITADERAAEVHARWRAGKTALQIAREFGFSERWAMKLIRRELERIRFVAKQLQLKGDK